MPLKPLESQHSAAKAKDVEGTDLTLKHLLCAPPIMPWREFADWIRMGDEHNIVWGWIRNGYIPLHKLGKHVMVNVALLTRELVEKERES